MVAQAALHPDHVHIQTARSDSQFDVYLHYALTLAGYRREEFSADVETIEPAVSAGLAYPAHLPRVIDPLVNSVESSLFSGQTQTVLLTTRVVAEPPLLASGESASGVYLFFVSAGPVRLKRAYRVEGNDVRALGPMHVRHVAAPAMIGGEY